MRLFQGPVVQHIVEDHRNAQRANLHVLCCLVFQSELQDQIVSLESPRPGNLQRDVRWKCRSEIGGRQSLLRLR